MKGSELINVLTPLSSLSKLERLDLSDLRRLRSIEPLRELVSLREIKTAFHPSVVAELKAHLAALRSDTSCIDISSEDWLREAIAFTDGQQFEQERFAATLGEAFSLLGEHEIVPPYQAFLDSRPDFSAMPWKAWLEGCAKNRGHDVMAREVERVPPEQLSPGGVGGRCAVLPGEDAPPDWQDWARDWLGRLESAQSSRAQQLLPVSAELCLAHARLGLREALERWLKRFTDPSDTAALDPVRAQQVMDLFLSLSNARKTAVCVVSHDLRWESYAHEVVAFENGRTQVRPGLAFGETLSGISTCETNRVT